MDFFEDYINKAPLSEGLQKNVNTRVYSVSVYQIDDNTYAYFFITLPEFRGVLYEHAILGSIIDGDMYYDGSCAFAYMLRHDVVDQIDGYFQNEWTFDVNPLDSVVPVETAVKNISEQMTEGVTFDVLTIEFVYVQRYARNEQGYVDIRTYDTDVHPAWRITLGNHNDDCTYICYVDAKDGGNFRYYATTGIRGFD